MGIVVRELREPWEFREAVRVQASAWRMSDLSEAVPAHMLKAVADNGGVVLGAFDGDRLVGFCFGFPGRSPEYGEYLYSHMAGVVEEYKYRGVGFLLKSEQRMWAIERGYKLMVWTFDPLQGLNSYFNLHKLGVVVRRFYPNYYGELEDGINRGMPTDRVKAEWWLLSPRVEARMRGFDARAYTEEMIGDDSLYVLRAGSGVEPVVYEGSTPHPVALAEIPLSVNELAKVDPGLPLRWRLALRRVLDHFLNKLGYMAVDFVRDRSRGVGVYVLVDASLHDVLSSNYWWTR